MRGGSGPINCIAELRLQLMALTGQLDDAALRVATDPARLLEAPGV